MQKLDRWPYLFRHKNGTLYYVRRVPTDLCETLRERQFRRSLKVKDERSQEAKVAYDAAHRQTENFMSELRAGRDLDVARTTYNQAATLAKRRGFSFRPLTDLVETATVEELVERLSAIEKRIEDKNDAEVDAIIGAVATPTFTLSKALDRYVALSTHELREKNDDQRRRWENPLRLAVQNFARVVADKDLSEITREDALAFRDWWVNDRIGKDVKTANTANKELMRLRKIFRTVNDAHRLGLENPFSSLSISGGETIRRVAIPTAHLEGVMLTDAALTDLNKEARGVVLAMADTGARINEITGLEADDIVLDHPVPHIVVRANAVRSLKTRHSNRQIPIVGVALKAFQENPAGFPRYAGKNAGASAAINKYLRARELLPEGCTLYGLRHGFQDRLIEVEAPERIQADLMGHKTLRPKYGKGPSLVQMQDWLKKTALSPHK